MAFQLITFQGARLALFNYNTGGKPGGYADFDNFKVDEPRAHGIERMIPLGKTITLTSGADGSLLAVDTQNRTLINVDVLPWRRFGAWVRFLWFRIFEYIINTLKHCDLPLCCIFKQNSPLVITLKIGQKLPLRPQAREEQLNLLPYCFFFRHRCQKIA